MLKNFAKLRKKMISETEEFLTDAICRSAACEWRQRSTRRRNGEPRDPSLHRAVPHVGSPVATERWEH